MSLRVKIETAQQGCTIKVGTAHCERIAFICRAPVMRVNPSYPVASQGYLGYSLDLFRLISMCINGVVAQWLWSSEVLSTLLKVFSLLLWNPKSPVKLCMLYFIIFSFFNLKFMLFGKCGLGSSGQRRRRGKKKVNKKQILSALFT